jgi:hypothetical protein
MTRPADRAALIALALPLALALVACGGSSKKASVTTTQAAATTPSTEAATTTSTTAAALSACDVVTKEQASALMQTTLLDGIHTPNADTDTCTYPGDPSGPTAQFEIFIGDGAKKYYDDDAVVLQHTFTDVPGIGDEAHEEDYALFFRKGTVWVVLRVTSLDDFTKFKPGLEALAKDVATKV